MAIKKRFSAVAQRFTSTIPAHRFGSIIIPAQRLASIIPARWLGSIIFVVWCVAFHAKWRLIKMWSVQAKWLRRQILDTLCPHVDRIWPRYWSDVGRYFANHLKITIYSNSSVAAATKPGSLYFNLTFLSWSQRFFGFYKSAKFGWQETRWTCSREPQYENKSQVQNFYRKTQGSLSIIWLKQYKHVWVYLLTFHCKRKALSK